MLKELFDLVNHSAGSTVINNPAVPNGQNADVVAEATNTVASGLRNIVAGGGAQNLLELFGKKDSAGGGLLNNPIVSMMIGHLSGKLMSKHNIGSTEASGIAGKLIPDVLSNLINKTNSSDDNGFSIGGLLNSITGGASNNVAQQNQSGGGLSDLLGKLTGGGNGGGGIMDIVTQLAGGAQQQQQRNGGSLIDLIKGFAR